MTEGVIATPFGSLKIYRDGEVTRALCPNCKMEIVDLIHSVVTICGNCERKILTFGAIVHHAEGKTKNRKLRDAHISLLKEFDKVRVVDD